MTTTLYSIQSQDGTLELAVCPATIEIRLSAIIRQEFDAACEAEKTKAKSGWFSLGGKIISGIVDMANKFSHFSGDTLEIIPLEAITEITYHDDCLQVIKTDGTQVTCAGEIGFASFKREFRFEAPQYFAESDAASFIACFTRIKLRYDVYLREVQQEM
jgi:hypothetical protein